MHGAFSPVAGALLVLLLHLLAMHEESSKALLHPLPVLSFVLLDWCMHAFFFPQSPAEHGSSSTIISTSSSVWSLSQSSSSNTNFSGISHVPRFMNNQTLVDIVAIHHLLRARSRFQLRRRTVPPLTGPARWSIFIMIHSYFSQSLSRRVLW